MQINKKLFFILLFFLFINIAVVSAHDTNYNDVELLYNQTTEQNSKIDVFEDVIDDLENSENQIVNKTAPLITVKSTNIKSKDTIEIYLKNSTGSPLKSKNLTALLNGKNYNLKTNSNGIAKLTTSLPSKTYKLTVSFKGDELYNATSKVFSIKVSKITTKLNVLNNFFINGQYVYVYLYDQILNSISHKKLTLKFNGEQYTRTTNQNGCVKLKLNSKSSKCSVKVNFKADKFYKSVSKTFKFYIVNAMSFKVGNSKLLTNGFLRVYLKDSASVWKKTIILNIGNNKLSKKTNSEGIVVFKPKADAKSYIIKVKYGKYVVSKKLKCVEGNAKDPLKENISLKNGLPDIDLMVGNYVMGDDNAKYTLTKSQYREVLKRDSHCLFLNNKLTKYTFFKTKSHPNTYHIVKREKWNVIERAINAKLVAKNKANYWPGSITVSLKGKSYTYPEVRDSQNTPYTCGPTSSSVCSQVLKSYFPERYFAKLMKTDKSGTGCQAICKGLEKKNFDCTFFYKSSFNKALNEIKKGGCALIFHADNHYVAILDISKDGKKVLVSNSYGSYDNIKTGWVKVSYLKNKFCPEWDESLIVRLDYKLSNSAINSVNSYYNSMGTNWVGKNTKQGIGYL